MNTAFGTRRQFLFDLVLLAFIFFFLLGYFHPDYLFSTTITTGGDTGSHYFTAAYLRDYLLPRAKISGWCHGNLAGFPVLQYYFPLPFLLMAVLSYLIPLQISFKMVTVAGVFLLPVATYLFFRCLKCPFPVPAVGASFSLGFLFMQGNTMWGGNIPSTLAGEFCYSIGFALTVLWAGLMFRYISSGRHWVGCAVVLALVGFSHAYPLLFAAAISSFFLLPGFFRPGCDFKTRLSFLFKVHGLAFLIMGFWLVPLLVFLPNTTRFNILWVFHSWKQFHNEVFPVILYPFAALALFGTISEAVRRVRRKRENRTAENPSGEGWKESFSAWGFVWFLTLSGLVLYGLGYRVRVVDIRFMPFFQFFLIVSGALFFSRIGSATLTRMLLAGVFTICTCLWVDANETFIVNWIRSNYIGFEGRPLWTAYSSVNRFLKGGPADPRVAYEHSTVYRRAGTVRAFEALPFFSGRSTLEGLYIQASPASPFIFYLQSEISQRPSNPIPDFNYSRFDLDRGIRHLHMFNVREVIAATPRTQRAMDADPRFRQIHRADPFRVYELSGGGKGYVQPLEYKPVRGKTVGVAAGRI